MASFCPSCGTASEGRFCPKCGAAKPEEAGSAAGSPDPVFTPPAASGVNAAGLSENVVCTLCYVLTFVTGILFLVLEPYNRNRTVRFHAFQAIFFGVGTVVVWVVFVAVSSVLAQIPVIGPMIDLLLLAAVWIGLFICWLMLMYKAYNNERFRLPVIGDLAEKQA